ncbi:hypothetical protein G6F68_018853 [Rhizopus microsporus]|nr:hypothetical protein G6F68_018853 [Rhizopus microsporus]
MLAAGREHQQGLSIQPHRGRQHQGAQLLTQRRAARFARGLHFHALRAQKVRDPDGVRAFARAVHALQRNEASA